ncbi:MAG: hypothetical protein ACRDL8_17840 [Solirubrobacteraceae bacterium]
MKGAITPTLIAGPEALALLPAGALELLPGLLLPALLLPALPPPGALLLVLLEPPQALTSAAAATAAIKARQLLEQPMGNLLLLKGLRRPPAGWPRSGHVSPASGTR